MNKIITVHLWIFLLQYLISYIKNAEKSDNLVKLGLRFGHASMTEGGQKNGGHFQEMIIMTNRVFNRVF